MTKGFFMRKMGLFAGVALLGFVLASCSSGPSKRAFGPYSEAETFYRQANYPKAIEKYQEYLTSFPQGNLAATAEYYIGKSYLAAGDTVKARESFERVAAKFPKTSWGAFAKEQLEILDGTANS
jgi:TolA-binding protein